MEADSGQGRKIHMFRSAEHSSLSVEGSNTVSHFMKGKEMPNQLSIVVVEQGS